MSADNWATCPRCFKRAVDDQEARVRAAADAYGKVPAPEFMELFAKASEPPRTEYTMREDYEVGVTCAGLFYVNYEAHCVESHGGCGFEFAYKHEEQVPA